ncbi:MAG TPA: VWA domain-containing protein [Gemmatimonadaceae bacterium]|nr:VWA domain-containing protein [Gemmatimonadaceae bacterium]
MMPVTFDYLWLLPLAIVLPIATIWLLRRTDKRRRERLQRLGDATVISRLLPPNAFQSRRWHIGRLAAAGALIGVGAAGPRWGTEQTIVRSRGIDMVFSLDASLSMMATDERPNRLTRMKQEVRRLRAMSAGDRVGLIAFAGRSYVLSPLTVDAGALDLFLDNLEPSVVGQAGSSLAKTIRQGTDLLLLTKTGADRALVVMSDGEAFEPVEDIVAEAKRAGEQGINLVTVGFGTPEGSRIPIRENNTNSFKLDENGQPVVTRYQPDLLQAAAQAANGTFIDASQSDKATRVRAALASLRRQQRVAAAGETKTPRFQWFLLPAVLLLILDTLLAERRGRRAKVTVAAREPALIATMLLLFLAGCARGPNATAAARAYHAKEFPRAASMYRGLINSGDRSVTTLYNYGTSLLAADSLAQAAEALERAAESKDAELRYRALFNLGLAHLQRGLALPQQQADEPLDAALAAYKKVLLLRSDDGDAKWNYELALRKKQQGGGGGGGGGESDPSPSPESNAPRPSGGLGERQAEQLLGSAAREERDVQAKRQRQNRVEPPPGGKDW